MLRGQERRTARAGHIDHPPSGSDDLANAACGALWLASASGVSVRFETVGLDAPGGARALATSQRRSFVDLSDIKDYQAVTVGIIGIGIAAITLLINANIPRWQRQREIDHESGMLRRGLITELRLVQAVVADGQKTLLNANLTRISIPREFGSIFFSENREKLGLLTIDEIGPVLGAYVSLEKFLRDARSHGTENTGGQYFNFEQKQFDTVRSWLDDLQTDVSAAIRELNLELSSGPYTKLVR